MPDLISRFLKVNGHTLVSRARFDRPKDPRRRQETGVKVSRYLLTVAEQVAEGGPVSGHGRELEKLAIEGMALAALGRIRARAATTSADKLTSGYITASIKVARRARG